MSATVMYISSCSGRLLGAALQSCSHEVQVLCKSSFCHMLLDDHSILGGFVHRLLTLRIHFIKCDGKHPMYSPGFRSSTIPTHACSQTPAAKAVRSYLTVCLIYESVRILCISLKDLFHCTYCSDYMIVSLSVALIRQNIKHHKHLNYLQATYLQGFYFHIQSA